MTSAANTTVRYELDGFAAKGGEEHMNRDGWGIAFAEERDAHIFREPAPADDSALAQMILAREIPCRSLIAHVRRASRGTAILANTHPFSRVRDGRVHLFAHNGTLKDIEDKPEVSTFLGQRVGDTDSELAFLILLERLATGAADDVSRFAIFTRFCSEMKELGSANFLFFDGRMLFVHADRRRFETPDGLTPPQEPGLVMRHFHDHADYCDWHTCGPKLRQIHPRTIVFASTPLDEERWDALPRGTCLALRDGEICSQAVS